MLFRKRPRTEETNEELNYHIERQVEQNIAQGMTPADARRSAMLLFGGVTQIREECRESRRSAWLDQLKQDLHYALRSVRRNPGFAAVVSGTLALGIGANTAVFSLLDAISYRPLPVDRPQELVYLRDPSFSYPIYKAVRDSARSFTGVIAWTNEQILVAAGGEPFRIDGLVVTENFHRVLGISAAIGRTFTETDADQPVAVVSDEFWRRNLGSDPAAVGRTIRVERLTFTVIGVTPAGFFGVAPGTRADVTIPVGLWPQVRGDGGGIDNPTSAFLHIMARLRSGVSMQQADSEVQVLWPQVLDRVTPRDVPADRRAHFLSRKTGLESAASGFSSVKRAVGRPLVWLMGIVGLVLLIACGNLANLMLARGVARRREVSIRAALGAGRRRIARQLLTEAGLMAFGGAALSLLVAYFFAEALKSLLSSSDWQVTVPFEVNTRVLAATAAFSILTLLIFAFVPSLRASRVDLTSLRTARGDIGGGQSFSSRFLVIAQVALTLVLVTGGALFTWSLRKLQSVETGFRGDRILILQADAAAEGYEGARLANFFFDLRQRLLATPGIESAAFSWAPPVSNDMGTWTQHVIIDQVSTGNGATVYFNTISPGFFETLSVPLLAGRDFTEQDRVDTPKVVIVNDAFARAYFAGQNPIGRRIGVGRAKSRQDLEIVGVAGNMVYQRLDEPLRRTVYLPWRQAPEMNLTAVIRLAGPLGSSAGAVRDVVRKADRNVHLEFQTLDGRIAESLVRERAVATLSGCFAALALLLAALGLYGVLAFTVSRRTQEIGVRLALGAAPSNVLKAVMLDALALIAVGVILGVPLCIWLSAGVRAMLFQMDANSTWAILPAAVTLLAAGALASWLPARRAASVDPMIALRQD